MVGLINGLRRYDEALLSRYGQEAVPMDVDLKQALFTFTNEPLMRIEGGIEKEGSDTAEVDPAFKGMRLSAQSPIFLRKVKEIWKVDLTAMRNDPRHDPNVIQQYLAAGKALAKAAANIRAGRYKTLQAAQRAVEDGAAGM
jgi:hypothetical protein